MRVLVGFAAIAAAICVSRDASADAYAFGGVSGRVRLDITILGFNEGAGVGGWELEDARALAAFARQVEPLLPRGAALSIERDVDADFTTLVMALPTRTEQFRLEGVPGYEEALTVLARASTAGPKLGPGSAPPPRTARQVKGGAAPGTKPEVWPWTSVFLGTAGSGRGLLAGSSGGGPVPKPAGNPELFTVQVLATRVEASASSFARALDARGIAAEPSFFWEACRPCSVPEAHVLERGPDAFFRVVIGIFDRRADADRFARELAKREGLRGFVRGI